MALCRPTADITHRTAKPIPSQSKTSQRFGRVDVLLGEAARPGLILPKLLALSLPKWPHTHQRLSLTNYPKLAAPQPKRQPTPRSPTTELSGARPPARVRLNVLFGGPAAK
jgi:hypothetical protein